MLQYAPYIIPLLVSAVIALLLGLFALRQRPYRTSLTFAALMFAVFIAVFMVALEQSSLDLAWRLFWANLSFTGIVFLPVFWFVLVLEYTGQVHLWRKYIPLLFVIPLLTLGVLWTNQYHHWWRGQSTLDMTTAPFPITVYNYGPWFYWIHAPFGYLLFAVGFILLVRFFVHSSTVYRKQTLFLLIAFLFPLLTETMYILGFSPVPNYSFTPVIFVASALLVAWSLFRYRFLNLAPVARSALVNAMEDVWIVLDDKDRLVDLNPAAKYVLGWESKNVVGQSIFQLLKDQSDLKTYFQTRQEQRGEICLEVDNEIRYFDARLNALRNRWGEYTGRLILLRDITGRKNIEEMLRRRNAELDAFSRMVAHDIRNPLATIMGFVDLLQDDKQQLSEAEADRIFGIINNMGQTAVSIVDELLLLATIRKENVELCLVDMAVVVQRACHRVENLRKKVEGEIILPETWPLVLGYAPWVEEIWVNYLSNGLKYGGQPPCLELGAEQMENGMVRLWVKDNGQGIPLDKKEMLFTEYSRLEPDRVDGYGLGLSVVTRIVEKLGGSAGVESKEGYGSCFYFTLPSYKPDEFEQRDATGGKDSEKTRM